MSNQLKEDTFLVIEAEVGCLQEKLRGAAVTIPTLLREMLLSFEGEDWTDAPSLITRMSKLGKELTVAGTDLKAAVQSLISFKKVVLEMYEMTVQQREVAIQLDGEKTSMLSQETPSPEQELEAIRGGSASLQDHPIHDPAG